MVLLANTLIHCLIVYLQLMHVSCTFPALGGVTPSQNPHGSLTASLLPSFPVPSGPPQGLAAKSRTATSITLSWRDPVPDKINDRDGIKRFVVRRDRQQVANITSRTYTVTGLSVATSYDFEVLAVNDQGIAPNNHAAQLTAITESGGTYVHMYVGTCNLNVCMYEFLY